MLARLNQSESSELQHMVSRLLDHITRRATSAPQRRPAPPWVGQRESLAYSTNNAGALHGFDRTAARAPSAARVRELTGAEKGTGVEQTTLADFFGAVPEEDRDKFDALAKTLQEQLSGVKVFKVGDEAERQVYIVGKAPDGRWAGLKTRVVET
jgi:hypothetical protein